MNRVPSFQSQLGTDFAEYIALRRALGYKFLSAEKILRNLDRFLVEQTPSAKDLSMAILVRWTTHRQAATRISNIGTIRQFCLHRRRSNADSFVPDRTLHRSLWPCRAFKRVPFIFAKEQVRQLLSAALALPATRLHPEKPQVLFTILLLLYAGGLRLSEGVTLCVGDVDFAEGILRIRETKFFKSRLVPVTREVLDKLHEFVKRSVPTNADPSHPIFCRGSEPYSPVVVGHLGREVLAACGFEVGVGRGRPRLHDLRHSFAVHRITQWYADGVNVQSRIPFLATYLGHKDVISVQRYVTVTAEILELAASRFERVCAPNGGR